MLIKPVTNQFITNKIQYSIMQSKKDKPLTERTITELPSFADTKSFVSINFKARIHNCAYIGYLEGVKEELAKGVDVNLPDEYGNTALIRASLNGLGHTETVKELLKHPDINVNAQNKNGITALMIASCSGHEGIVKELLKHPDIDVNIQSKSGRTALMEASWNGNTEKAKELLKYPDIDVNVQIINSTTASTIYSIYKAKIVKELLKHPDIDVNTQDNNGITVLMEASWYGHTETVKELLKHPDVDVNLKDIYGDSATSIKDRIIEPTIKEMIQNYVRGVDNREEVLSKKVDIKKLTPFDEICTDEEKYTLEKVIKKKDFNALLEFFETKLVELKEKSKPLTTSEKIAKLNKEKDKYEKQNEALNNVIQNYQAILADEIAYEKETLESGFRTLYGIKPQEIPENTTFGEQMVYVTDVLLNRRNKLLGTDGDTPERITKALQDKNGKISQDDLKFLERVIDASNRECTEQDLIEAIESVKDDHGLLNMGAVTFFISSLAWAGNSIRSVIEKVGKYGVNAKKIIR